MSALCVAACFNKSSIASCVRSGMSAVAMSASLSGSSWERPAFRFSSSPPRSSTAISSGTAFNLSDTSLGHTTTIFPISLWLLRISKTYETIGLPWISIRASYFASSHSASFPSFGAPARTTAFTISIALPPRSGE